MKRSIVLGLVLLSAYPIISRADGASDNAHRDQVTAGNMTKAWIVPMVRPQNKPPLDPAPKEVVLAILQANRCLRLGKLSNGADVEDGAAQGQLAESTVALAKQKAGMDKVVRIEECDTLAYGYLWRPLQSANHDRLRETKKTNLAMM